MIMLLDAGNSRLKWALCDEHGDLHGFGSAHYPNLDVLENLVREIDPTAVYGVAVCGATKQLLIESACPKKILWQTSQVEAIGIINHYDHPSELGADRWFNVLGARRFNTEDALVVVSCGTATTIDVLTADNRYLGGSIIPGIHLMHTALSRHTAQLKRALGQFHDVAQNTPDAMATGIIDASCGAIERQKNRLAQMDSGHHVKIILTGGGANVLHPFLDKNHQNIDNLVLFGLARWVNR